MSRAGGLCFDVDASSGEASGSLLATLRVLLADDSAVAKIVAKKKGTARSEARESSPCHICTGTGLTAATSAPRLGPPLPRLRRDWAHPSHVCSVTGLTAATSAL